MRNKSEAQIFLEQVERLDVQIKNKLIEKQQWKDIALGITANMDGERVQSSGAKSKMADAIIKCVDMESEIDRLIDNLVDTKRDVLQTIEQLYSPTEYNVLHMRFIQYKTLQEIADHYGRDYEWAKLTCKRGCKHVQVILNRKEKIDEASTIDAEEAVWCKDCKHCAYDAFVDDHVCIKLSKCVEEDFFCSYWEKNDPK